MSTPNINRRDFLKLIGGATTTVSLASCGGMSDNSIHSNEVNNGDMSYRTSKVQGDKVSLLGYGCLRWPLLKEPDEEGCIVDQEAANELVDYALEHGVNYFDTAPPYTQGWSEIVTGRALKRHPRDKYFVATKISNFNSKFWDLEESKNLYYRSMERLQVDYIDYLVLHSVGSVGWDTFYNRFISNGLIDFLIEERKAGRLRNLGFSFHGDIKAFDYLLSRHDEFKWDFVQIQLTYIDWNYAGANNMDAVYLYNELAKRDIDVVVMGPLSGGRLAKLPSRLDTMLRTMRPDKSVASWAYRFAATPPKVLTVLSGMDNMECLKENISTFSPLDPITDEENVALMEIADKIKDYDLIRCTACQYCMPCPYGVDIPGVFGHFNKCIREETFPQSTQDEEYAKSRRAFLVGYDRQVPKLRQADHCIDCKKCKGHCPQNIDIPAEMKRVNRYAESLKQDKFEG